jgi:hypothetical protein
VSALDTTRPTATRVVSLREIQCDRRAFPRQGLDSARVAEFAALYRDELPAGRDPLPALGCVEDRDGRLILFDGWHRREAREQVVAQLPEQGFDDIPVSVVRADEREPVDLAFELALDTCARGPWPLTTRERVTAAKRLAVTRPDLSAKEIARRTGLSHVAVLRYRGTVAPSANPRATQRDGSGPTTRRTAIEHLLRYGERDELDSEGLADELRDELLKRYPDRANAAVWATWWAAGFEDARALLEAAG